MGECPFEEGDLLALITEGSSRAVLVSGLHVRRREEEGEKEENSLMSLNTLHLLLHSP